MANYNTLQDRSPLQAQTQLKHYEITSTLATGGNAIVYAARDTHKNCPVVIKEFFPQNLAIRRQNSRICPISKAQENQFQYGVQAFQNEAKILSHLDDPMFVYSLNHFCCNSTQYLVLDYESGETLNQVLRNLAQPDVIQIDQLLLFLLDAISTMNQKNVIHRDIKPSNIFLRKRGGYVLLDFGSAAFTACNHRYSGPGFRTKGYSPIELYSARYPQGIWTDLYSVGATLYRCITGKNPIDAPRRLAMIKKGLPDPLEPLHAKLYNYFPVNELDAINWMLELYPWNRPSTAAELKNWLLR